MKAHQLRPLGLLAMLVCYGMQHFLHSSPTRTQRGEPGHKEGGGGIVAHHNNVPESAANGVSQPLALCMPNVL